MTEVSSWCRRRARLGSRPCGLLTADATVRSHEVMRALEKGRGSLQGCFCRVSHDVGSTLLDHPASVASAVTFLRAGSSSVPTSFFHH